MMLPIRYRENSLENSWENSLEIPRNALTEDGRVLRGKPNEYYAAAQRRLVWKKLARL